MISDGGPIQGGPYRVRKEKMVNQQEASEFDGDEQPELPHEWQARGKEKIMNPLSTHGATPLAAGIVAHNIVLLI